MIWRNLLGFRRPAVTTDDRVSRRRGESSASGNTFVPSPTCQIPELANLYSIYFGNKKDGSFVEVGAFDAESFSNSSCLADAGWSGLLLEPVPEFADLCRSRYANNTRIKVIQSAVGASRGQVQIDVAGSLSTTQTELLGEYQNIPWAKGAVKDARRIQAEQFPLDEILSENKFSPEFDVLIVDVEGGERAVFDGLSIKHWMPKMMIVELVHTHPDLRNICHSDADLQRTICAHGYEIVYKDMINTVFVSRKIA
jgi:FkbM family methyltransferase